MVRRLALHILAVLLFASLVCQEARSQGFQTMAIASGVVADFAGAAAQNIAAFCIDKGLHIPTEDAPFTSFSGRVRLDFRDGSSRELNLSEANGYISVQGNGTFTGLKVSRVDPNVARVQFLTASVAHAGAPEDLARAAQFAEKIQPVLHSDLPPEQKAREVWHQAFTVRRSLPDSPNKYVVLDSDRRDPRNTLSQTIVQLPSRGDSFVIETPQHQFLTVDSGLTAEGGDRILAQLPKAHKVQATLILSHRDTDHIGNAQRLLASSQLDVQRIVMSNWHGEAPTKRYQDLIDTLNRLGFSEQRVPDAALSIYSKTPSSGSVIRSRQLTLGSRVLATEVAAFDLEVESSVHVELLQFRQAQTPNQSSLVTTVAHNGYTTVYAGDLDAEAMSAFVKFGEKQEAISELSETEKYLEVFHKLLPTEAHDLDVKYPTLSLEKLGDYLKDAQRIVKEKHVEKAVAEDLDAFATAYHDVHYVDLHCEFLKWPHHAWIPKTPREQQVVKDFIAAVSPRCIIFSVGPTEIPGQSVADAIAFLKASFPKRTFEFYITREDGQIKLLTINLLRIMGNRLAA